LLSSSSSSSSSSVNVSIGFQNVESEKVVEEAFRFFSILSSALSLYSSTMLDLPQIQHRKYDSDQICTALKEHSQLLKRELLMSGFDLLKAPVEVSSSSSSSTSSSKWLGFRLRHASEFYSFLSSSASSSPSTDGDVIFNSLQLLFAAFDESLHPAHSSSTPPSHGNLIPESHPCEDDEVAKKPVEEVHAGQVENDDKRDGEDDENDEDSYEIVEE
jgi:hypothetical protein